MVFGVLLSGYVMTKYRPSARKVTSFVAVTKYVYAFGMLLVMLADCGFENDLPGTLTADGRYHNQPTHDPDRSRKSCRRSAALTHLSV